MKHEISRIPCRILALVVGLLLSAGAYAQITVDGLVKDAEGFEIIGAHVRVQGQEGGAVTDIDGKFQLKAPAGSKLEISYIGYQTAIVSAQPKVVVTLQEDSKVMADVVVIGYGRAKKTDLTGSVAAIKPDEMNHGLQTSPQDMLQGKVAGVNVQNGGGEPGGGASIRIRGGSSLNASNDPLIVIDGLALDSYGMQGASNPLNLVNPADIESFTVLKDASATAIYGSRASNGVIIITTKKGRKGMKPQVTYSGNVSVSAALKHVDVMNASEYVGYVRQRAGFGDKTDAEWMGSEYYQRLGMPVYQNGVVVRDENGNPVRKMYNTDWQDEIYRTAVSTDHNITVAGSTKHMPYRVSVGYTSQQGILKTSSYERWTGSVALNPSFLNDHLTINFNAKGMLSHTQYAQTGAIGQATSMDPTKPVKVSAEEDPTGMYKNAFNGYFQYHTLVTDRNDPYWQYGINTLSPRNPKSTLNEGEDRGTGKELTGNIEIDYKIHGLEDLHLHANLGGDFKWGESNKEYSRYNYDNYYYGSKGWNTQRTYNLSLNAYAQYMKELKNHYIDVMAGYEWQRFNLKSDYFYQGTYPMTNTKNPGEPYNPSTNTLYKTENYLVSFFGRINYTALNRYMLTFTMRADGSSRFAKNKRWGYFPSAAIAWRVNEEPFLRDSKVVNDFKIRAGWGMTGQQEGIADYYYIPTYQTMSNGAYYPIYGSGATARPQVYNTNLTWEKTTTYNVGIDMGFLNNRIEFSVDAYYRKTTDLINTVAIAAGTQFSNKMTSNIGGLHNTGIEGSITVRPIETKNWHWEVSYNVTWNKNKIDQLTASNDPNYKILHGGVAVGDGGSDGIQAWMVGQPVSAFYCFQQVYGANGQPLEGVFVDRNGDGIINNDDRYFYKKADADVLMGLSTKLTYKNWDLGFTLRSSINNYAYNAVEADRSNTSIGRLASGTGMSNVTKMAVDKAWNNVSTTDALSDYFIQNASFLKCDNITLGYSFKGLLKDAKYEGVSGRLYITASNVFTITKYKGLDPEVGSYDGNIYPRPFTGIIGLSLNF